MQKKLKIIFYMTLMLIISSPSFFKGLNAQTVKLTQTIRGKVTDRDSKFTIPDVNIIIRDTSPALGTSTDAQGNYVIRNVPLGRHTLEFIYIGYAPLNISNILVGSGREVIVNAELAESLIESEAIEVKVEIEKEKAVNEMASVSARAFTVEETSRYAASINDPARMALSFAGVTSSGSDAMNEIVIRGNSPRGMSWNIEGVAVSNPNHFTEEGNTGGAIGLISNNMLDNSDFLTGAWPAVFGNALSGIFDINFRKGNTAAFEHALQFSPLGVDISSEGPITALNGASYLVNYRYSTLSLFDAAGISIVEKNKGLPDFQDLAYKFFLPTQKYGVFSIWGIGGLSSTISESIIKTGQTNDNKEYYYLEEEGEKVNSDIAIAGVTHMYFTDKTSYLKTALSLNATHMKLQEEGLVSNALQNINSVEFKNFKSVFSTQYNRKVSAKNTFQLGFIINNLSYSSKSLEYNGRNDRMVKYVDASANSNLYQGYMQAKYKWSNSTTIFSGIHSSYFALNDHYTIEPRLSFKWDITDKRSLTAGLGFHSQLNPLSLYLMKNAGGAQVNRDLDFLKARHFVLSYNEMLFEQWRLKVELYYQHLYSIPIAKDSTDTNHSSTFLKTYSALNAGATLDYIDLQNGGTGKNYGIEVTLEKFFDAGWYFLSTSSFYQAKYKGLDGVERDTRFNGNYTLNLLAGKEFYTTSDNVLGFNVRLIRAGGKRDIPVQPAKVLLDANQQPVIDKISGKQVMYAPDDYDNAFAKQMDDYFRIDLGISYRLNYAHLAHIFSLDFQNILNRENIRKIDYYDVENKKYVYKTQAGIIPSFKYRIEF